jgi:hypothetical protein
MGSGGRATLIPNFCTRSWWLVIFNNFCVHCVKKKLVGSRGLLDVLEKSVFILPVAYSQWQVHCSDCCGFMRTNASYLTYVQFSWCWTACYVLVNDVAYLTDMFLQSFNAKTPDDEPQFESSKPLAKWDLPVLFCYKSRRNGLQSVIRIRV